VSNLLHSLTCDFLDVSVNADGSVLDLNLVLEVDSLV
jgi:hypothetical protein